MYSTKKIFYLPLIMVFFLIFYYYSMKDWEKIPTIKPKNEVEKVKIGLPLQPTSSLSIIALKNGFFEANGLDAEVTFYQSGKRVLLDGLKYDEVDIAETADVGYLGNIFQVPNSRIIASINRSDNTNRIIVRKDSGIKTPYEIEGKKIATQQFSAVHFFLHRFLQKYNLHESTHENLIYKKAEELPLALKRGEIDGFSMREPYISQAAKLLDGKVIIFEEPGLYEQYSLLIAKKEYIEKNKSICIKYLKALEDAKNFYEKNKESSVKQVAEFLSADIQEMQTVLDSMKFNITLQDPIRIILASQINWLKNENRNMERFQIDISSYIDVLLLKSIYPERIYKEVK